MLYAYTGRAYIGTRPSKKSIKRMVESITEETDRAAPYWMPSNGGTAESENDWLGKLLLPGADQLFLQAINSHESSGFAGGCARNIRSEAKEYNVIRTSTSTKNWGWSICRDEPSLPWRNARNLVREPDALNGPVRFDEREVETGLWRSYLGTARPKEAETDKPRPTATAPHSTLYTGVFHFFFDDSCALLMKAAIPRQFIPITCSLRLPSSSKEESQVFSSQYTLLKSVNGCGGTSTFFPFHLTSFILRAIYAQLTLCRTKRVVEVDQAESRKPYDLRSSSVLPSTTTTFLFYALASAGAISSNPRSSRNSAKITLISLIATAQIISFLLGCWPTLFFVST